MENFVLEMDVCFILGYLYHHHVVVYFWHGLGPSSFFVLHGRLQVLHIGITLRGHYTQRTDCPRMRAHCLFFFDKFFRMND